ncbi:MAG: TonB-dependent receptor, partial [Bacteroidales bacterium]|nr:TonB-dependent receptor [Bacteroidales bacterium]
AAGQQTDRTHYTGVIPENTDTLSFTEHVTNPPYGYSDNTTLQAGAQFNHRLNSFLNGQNVLTIGIEHVYDDIVDSIDAYQYGTDQTTNNFASFLQSDWDITKNFNLLAGVRMDKHNLVDNMIVSPRVSLLYKLKDYTQFRLTWGTGFRAPQAFDADMHIAFAGGGISRISLDPNLKEERSNSISGSVNFDYPTEKFIAGFTFEGFYTKLEDAFYLKPVGVDSLGELYVKSNGPGAVVKGVTLEFRANYLKKYQIEAGYTLQSSTHDEAVEVLDGLGAKKEFLRTPNQYGYAMLTFMPNKKINASISTVYTGSMDLAHAGGAPEQPVDEYVTTSSFAEVNIKVGYTFALKSLDSGIEIFGGIKNLTNSYQNDFDSGKERDSNYVYGPGTPRTLYIGLKLLSL